MAINPVFIVNIFNKLQPLVPTPFHQIADTKVVQPTK